MASPQGTARGRRPVVIVFSMSFNFQPDFYNGSNRVVKGILNGWSISPIVKIRSGRPFTVTNGGVDANLDGVATDRARLIGDPYLASPTAARWFNTAAFAQNTMVVEIVEHVTIERAVAQVIVNCGIKGHRQSVNTDLESDNAFFRRA